LIYSGRDAFEEQPPELDGVPWIEKPQAPEAVARSAAELLDRPTESTFAGVCARAS
jgi:hypothetical protein